MSPELPLWAREMALVAEDDACLPSGIDGLNLVLNRRRLAAFLARFAEDKDVRDLLAVDVLGSTAGLPLSSTGAVESIPSLALRPFRLWEYLWLYKSLGLSAGGLNVLDLGGPATHLSVLAAIAGCRVTSIDINPVFVAAAKECAGILNLNSLDARVGDMRDLSAFSGEQFHVVMSCSVLEHLTAEDQKTALCEIARVLRPGGLVGLTFDIGIGAPGANEHLPPPHAPPPSAMDAIQRYVQGGLEPVGNPFSEDPIPGGLFRHEFISYSVASLFLAKSPAPDTRFPQCEPNGSVFGRLAIRDLPCRIHNHVTSTIASAAQSQAYLTAVLEESERLRQQFATAVATVEEQHQRADVLEKAAAERLAAMLEKDQAILLLDRELRARDAGLEIASEETAKLRQSIAELEQRENQLQQRVQELERESLMDFVSRRRRLHRTGT